MHNRTYPIDIHCCAQGILTYLAFGDVAKAEGVARWALKNIWDGRGFSGINGSRWLLPHPVFALVTVVMYFA